MGSAVKEERFNQQQGSLFDEERQGKQLEMFRNESELHFMHLFRACDVEGSNNVEKEAAKGFLLKFSRAD